MDTFTKENQSNDGSERNTGIGKMQLRKMSENNYPSWELGLSAETRVQLSIALFPDAQ
jgi:hypothetical protein